MPIDNGSSSLKTPCGTIFGILTVLIVLAFTAQKIIVLQTKSDINIITTDLVDNYDSEYEFGGKNGVNLAAALIDWPFKEWDFDDTYGKIRFYNVSWGFDDTTGENWFTEIELPTHRCTKEELGLDDSAGEDKAAFYPTSIKFKRDLQEYWNNFICLDNPEDIALRGDLSSARSSLLEVKITRCDSSEEENCKSDEITHKFFEGKYIAILTNQIRFDSNQYGEDSIIRESRLDWLEYAMSVTQALEMKIKKTNLYLQDLGLNLDSLTEYDNESPF